MEVIGQINVRFCDFKLLGRKVDVLTSTAFSVPAIVKDKFQKMYFNIYALALEIIICILELINNAHHTAPGIH